MDLYPIFQWLEATPIGDAIKQSTWMFPVIEAVHLLALASLGGALILLDLRLLGAGLTAQPPSTLERATRPWLIGAVVVMILSGILIGLSEALKLYDRKAFAVKMAALAAALLFTFLIRNPLARRDIAGLAAKAVAVVSLALWFTVAMAGRWIGFS